MAQGGVRDGRGWRRKKMRGRQRNNKRTADVRSNKMVAGKWRNKRAERGMSENMVEGVTQELLCCAVLEEKMVSV